MMSAWWLLLIVPVCVMSGAVMVWGYALHKTKKEIEDYREIKDYSKNDRVAREKTLEDKIEDRGTEDKREGMDED